MNPDTTPSESSQPAPEVVAPPFTASPIDWRSWLRRLLVCNPFFLCSAMLLLFGVNRLSLDPGFLGDERANLVFNYGALQFYEWLVVLTAIVLARRRVWYDSALLAVMENGLVLVPFLLISQATLLSRSMGTLLALGALIFAVARAVAVRRFFPEFNLPSRALLLGLALLILNALLPSLYPLAVEKDTNDWAQPNFLLWTFVLPGLVAGANFLPQPTRYGGRNPERQWLPLFNYALWTASTGVHFWSLSHVSGLTFETRWLAPALLAVVWTFQARLEDCLMVPPVNLRKVLLGLAFVTPLLALTDPELFETLVLANAVGWGWLYLRGAAVRTFARELLVLSLPLAVFGLPESVGRILLPYYTRLNGPALGLALLLVFYALRWFRVPLALAGAPGLAVLVAFLYPGAPLQAYVQTMALFVLTHSLAWRQGAGGGTFLRASAGLVWMLNTLAWLHDYPRWGTAAGITLSAALVLVAWAAIWRFSPERPSLLVAAPAGLVLLTAPTGWLWQFGSAGAVALVGSALLFAAGTGLAWTRQAWERSHH